MGEIFHREFASRSAEWTTSPEHRALRQPPLKVSHDPPLAQSRHVLVRSAASTRGTRGVFCSKRSRAGVSRPGCQCWNLKGRDLEGQREPLAQPDQGLPRSPGVARVLTAPAWQLAHNANRGTHAFYARDPNAGEAPALTGKAFLQSCERSPGVHALHLFEDFGPRAPTWLTLQNPTSPFGPDRRGIRASSSASDVFLVQPPMRF
jgi:hypothetical protein